MTILDALKQWWFSLLLRNDEADLIELNRMRCYYIRKLQQVESEIRKRIKPSGVISR